MDLTFQTDSGIFNYRVCAVILNDNRILAMQDDRSPYYYLPGGRVSLGETAEDAVLREVQEELGIAAKIQRPLWLNQAFFTEDVSGQRFHELCIYYLIDISGTDLLSRGSTFVCREGTRTHRYEWLSFDQLEQEYFYPIFLKKEIFHLPDVFTLRAEWE
jgi:8-oxo-dGTP pyrophosphatase MutT (NUDIX family)